MRFIILIFFSVLVFSESQAQNIMVNKDPEVARVMDQYGATNRMTGFTSGWRVQLLATTDRMKMEKAKEDFLLKYPQISVDFVHSSPYYKLLAGAFRSKLEASRIVHQVKRDYPSAFPTKSKNIRPGELVGIRYNY